MATQTTKLKLRKPEENDYYNEQLEQAENWDKVDEAVSNDTGAVVGHNRIKYIQDVGEKVTGKLYYDKLQSGLWYCKTTNDSIVNDSNFEDWSNYANGKKINNKVKKMLNTPQQFNSELIIISKSEYDSFNDSDSVCAMFDTNNVGEATIIGFPVAALRRSNSSITSPLFDDTAATKRNVGIKVDSRGVVAYTSIQTYLRFLLVTR